MAPKIIKLIQAYLFHDHKRGVESMSGTAPSASVGTDSEIAARQYMAAHDAFFRPDARVVDAETGHEATKTERPSLLLVREVRDLLDERASLDSKIRLGLFNCIRIRAGASHIVP